MTVAIPVIRQAVWKRTCTGQDTTFPVRDVMVVSRMFWPEPSRSQVRLESRDVQIAMTQGTASQWQASFLQTRQAMEECSAQAVTTHHTELLSLQNLEMVFLIIVNNVIPVI